MLPIRTLFLLAAVVSAVAETSRHALRRRPGTLLTVCGVIRWKC